LAAYRAGAAETRLRGPYGADNLGNPEKPFSADAGGDAGMGFRHFRDFRDREHPKNTVLPPTPGPDHDAAEREALAAFHAADPDTHAHQPGDPDPLQDGLLAGWRRHGPVPAG
jgi:hypothetical protein